MMPRAKYVAELGCDTFAMTAWVMTAQTVSDWTGVLKIFMAAAIHLGDPDLVRRMQLVSSVMCGCVVDVAETAEPG
jgi:hypothetical protein